MPRKRATDYGDKREHILNVASTMFAEFGFSGCRMEDIAHKCDVSKSALYHYFKTKENVLFELLNNHVSALILFIEGHLNSQKSETPEVFFRNFVRAYLSQPPSSRERHAVTLKDTRYLTTEQMKVQDELERNMLAQLVEVIRRVRPDLKPSEYKVYAFLLVGMLNWVELWFRSSGSMSRFELADRISMLFLRGIAEGENSLESLVFS